MPDYMLQYSAFARIAQYFEGGTEASELGGILQIVQATEIEVRERNSVAAHFA